MNKKRILLVTLSLICVLVVGIGFAAISRNLFIAGTVSVAPGDFDVRFESGTGYIVSSTEKEADTVEVVGVELFKRQQLKRIDFNIHNYSTDYVAEINLDDFSPVVTSTTGMNIEDIGFGVGSIYTPGNTNILYVQPGESSVISLIIVLYKAQVETETLDFTIKLKANAIVVDA